MSKMRFAYFFNENDEEKKEIDKNGVEFIENVEVRILSNLNKSFDIEIDKRKMFFETDNNIKAVDKSLEESEKDFIFIAVKNVSKATLRDFANSILETLDNIEKPQMSREEQIEKAKQMYQMYLEVENVK